VTEEHEYDRERARQVVRFDPLGHLFSTPTAPFGRRLSPGESIDGSSPLQARRQPVLSRESLQ
jgi:hypothetical protein